MQYLEWLNLITRLAGIVAKEQGAAPRELAYLNFLTSGVSLATVTSSELAELEAKYEAERGQPIEADSLDELIARLKARSERIQGG